MAFRLSPKKMMERIAQQYAGSGGSGGEGGSSIPHVSTRANLPATAVDETIYYVESEDVFVSFESSLGGFVDTGLKLSDLDIRYYTKTSVDTLLEGKASSTHTHSELQFTNKEDLDRLGVSVNDKLTIDGVEVVSEGGTNVSDIDDTTTSATKTYSSQKIEDKLALKSDSNHTHDYASKSSEHTHSNKSILDNLSEVGGKLAYFGEEIASSNGVEINDVLASTDSVYSSEKTNQLLNGKAPNSHTHSEYSPTNHTHANYIDLTTGDGRYAPKEHEHLDYTSVDAVNNLIATAVSLRDSALVMTGVVEEGNTVYLEGSFNGVPISIPVNVMALPVPSQQDGSAEFPYVIASVDDWNNAKNRTNATTSHWKLWKSLDFAGATVEPLFTSTFDGVFEGNNKVISNMVISKPTTSYLGIIPSLRGTLKNLIADTISVDGAENVGVLSGTLTKTPGGVIATIEKCKVINSTISATAQVGMLSGVSSGKILKSMAHGTITGKAGSRYIGGLAGQHNYNDGLMEDSYSLVNVSATNYGAAALIGGTAFSGSPIVRRCYGAGTVTGAATNKGAIYGYIVSGTPVCTNCYYDNTLYTPADTRGTGVSTANFGTEANFSGFDFTLVWQMGTAQSGNQRPILR